MIGRLRGIVAEVGEEDALIDVVGVGYQVRCGARTLSRDPRWMHINSRRIVSVVSEQLRRDSEWAVFENQSPELWKTLERTVRHRMDAMWDGGLLSGPRAGEEYMIMSESDILAIID